MKSGLHGGIIRFSDFKICLLIRWWMVGAMVDGGVSQKKNGVTFYNHAVF